MPAYSYSILNIPEAQAFVFRLLPQVLNFMNRRTIMDMKDLFFFLWTTTVGLVGIGLVVYVMTLKKKEQEKSLS